MAKNIPIVEKLGEKPKSTVTQGRKNKYKNREEFFQKILTTIGALILSVFMFAGCNLIEVNNANITGREYVSSFIAYGLNTEERSYKNIIGTNIKQKRVYLTHNKTPKHKPKHKARTQFQCFFSVKNSNQQSRK